MQSSPPKAQPFQRNHKIRDAISMAIYDEMGDDPAIHLFGEGAAVKIHYDAPAIEKTFPRRIHTLPICEDGSTNFCVGASLLGVKPVVDVITADFLYRTMDSICNTAAKLNYLRHPDQPASTIVIRSEFLTAGPTTGQRPEALFCHIPGLSVVLPSNPRDAYGLMRTALTEPGVTLFFEDRMIDDALISATDQRILGPIGFGYALERRNGNSTPDLTIVTYGVMVQMTEQALWSGRSITPNIDLIDLRCLYPIDWREIWSSTRRSRKLLVIEPDIEYGGIGAEIIAHMAEMDQGVRLYRLGGPKSIIPASSEHHARIMPSQKEIQDAVASCIG